MLPKVNLFSVYVPNFNVIFKIMNDIPKKLIIDQTENYFDLLRKVHQDLKKENPPDYLLFCYLSLCSATLEYSINWVFIDFCISKFGLDEYQTYAEAYLSNSFKSKLYLMPITVTESKFRFNGNHKAIKTLEQLISRRNTMLHNKSFLKYIDVEIIKRTEDEIESFNINNFKFNNLLISLCKKEVFDYGTALGKLRRDFFDQYRNSSIKETDLIKRI